MKNVPHLTFLRSFEAAARHMSFTSAAEELNCTQSAVSNHVRSLEEFIGRPLFVRHPRSLTMTDVGEAYFPSVRHALQEIDGATQSLISHSHKREVVISCPFSLAINWLPKVIQGFNEVHPNVGVTIHGTVWTDVEPEISDISITIKHIEDVSLNEAMLWEEKVSLVCAPAYLVNGVSLTKPSQLPKAQLIHVLGRPDYWKRIFEYFQLDEMETMGGMQTNSPGVAMEMAAAKLGCAALPKSLIKPYLDRNILHEPFKTDIPSPWAYFADFKEKSATPPVKLFQKWLLKAAQDMPD